LIARIRNSEETHISETTEATEPHYRILGDSHF